MKLRVVSHPILGEAENTEYVTIVVDGKEIRAVAGEMIAAALMANGIMVHRHTIRRPNVRTCITPVEEGMVIETQEGYGMRGGQV